MQAVERSFDCGGLLGVRGTQSVYFALDGFLRRLIVRCIHERLTGGTFFVDAEAIEFLSERDTCVGGSAVLSGQSGMCRRDIRSFGLERHAARIGAVALCELFVEGRQVYQPFGHSDVLCLCSFDFLTERLDAVECPLCITNVEHQCIALRSDTVQLRFVISSLFKCTIEIGCFALAGFGIGECDPQLFAFGICTVQGAFDDGTPLGDSLLGFLFLCGQGIILRTHRIERVVARFDCYVLGIPCFDF